MNRELPNGPSSFSVPVTMIAANQRVTGTSTVDPSIASQTRSAKNLSAVETSHRNLCSWRLPTTSGLAPRPTFVQSEESSPTSTRHFSLYLDRQKHDDGKEVDFVVGCVPPTPITVIRAHDQEPPPPPHCPQHEYVNTEIICKETLYLPSL